MQADLVLEGGGVRGIAYAGALEMFERSTWEWRRAAGSSAGAIVAALVACGLHSRDILDVLRATNFRSFLDPRPLLVAWDTYRYLGFCRGDRFEAWFRGIVGELSMGGTVIPLTVITSDLANDEILAISSTSHPEMPVAQAVRMSMSIPGVFRAVRWNDAGVERVCVDGGVCANYPIDIFDVAREPRWPTIGMLLDEGPRARATIRDVRDGVIRLVEFMRGAPAKRLDEHNAYRSVKIPDGGVSWLNFSVKEDEVRSLLSSGRTAAEAFLRRWESGGGFAAYVKAFRS